MSLSSPQGFAHDGWAAFDHPLLSSTPSQVKVLIYTKPDVGARTEYDYAAKSLALNGQVIDVPDFGNTVFKEYAVADAFRSGGPRLRLLQPPLRPQRRALLLSRRHLV